MTNTDRISTPFWKNKSLQEMTEEEWELLCDGCGKCCMLKLEDEDTGVLYHTRLSCRLLDLGACRCSDYSNRHNIIPDCIRLTCDNIASIAWLPDTCAYRLVLEGKDLHWWHHLMSGDRESVHEAGVSVRSWALSEQKVDSEKHYKFIISD